MELYDASPSLVRFHNWIDGKACEAVNGRWLESVDPARAEVWALVPDGRAPDVDRAVQAARRAFRDGAWRGLTAAERARLLRRVGDLASARAEELARLESRDNGKVLRERGPEVSAVPERYHYRPAAAHQGQGDTIPLGR